MNINDLPDDVLLEIFSHLSAEDLAMSVAFVCHRWNSISSMAILWKNLTFTPPINMSDSGIIHCLEYMPNLRSFELYYGEDIDEIVEALIKLCSCIRSIVMKWKNGPKLKMIRNILKKLPDIEYLDVMVPNSQFTLDFAKIYGKPKENIISMINSFDRQPPWLLNDPDKLTNFGDAEIRSLIVKNTCILDTLILRCQMSSETFSIICECINLKYLFISNEHESQTIVNLTPLIQLKNLVTLQLECFHRCTFNHLYVNNIEFLRLERLEIVEKTCVFDNIFDNILKNSPNLNQLNLRNNPISDNFLENISICSTLTHIDIADTPNLTDEFVKHVAKGCFNLEFFDVSYCDEITEDIITILTPCQKLKCLRMNGIMLSENVFMLIPEFLPSIIELSVKHCGLKRNSIIPPTWPDIKLSLCFELYSDCSSDETE